MTVAKHINEMPPRLHLIRSGLARSIQSRPWTISSNVTPLCLRPAARRGISADEKPLPQAEGPGPGPNQEQLPHVSEEAAEIGKITGKGGPEIEQGTPIQEVGCAICFAT